MSFDDIDDFDPEIEELKSQRLFERRRNARLLAHPDCRDPDHPGCEHCDDEHNDD